MGKPFGCVLVAVAVAGSASAQGLLPYQNPEAIAVGQEVYGAYCAACHGDNLEGQVPDWRSPGPDGLLPAPPHDETGHTWHHADQLLFEITKFGTEALVGGTYRSNMSGFGDVLTDGEILAVLAFIKSTWPERVISTHNRINAQAAQARQQ